jgi:formate hydrogenlyase transcriptional activator
LPENDGTFRFVTPQPKLVSEHSTLKYNAEKFLVKDIDLRRPASIVLRYATAAAAIGVVLGLGLLLRNYGLPHPFSSFSLAAIALLFWYAGTGPGLFAVALSYLVLTTFFAPVKIGGPSSEFYVIIYGIFGLFLSWFSSSRRRAERLLTEARDNLEVRVAERTSELTSSNSELQRTQSQLNIEKNRLKLLLDLTNNLVSTPNIGDALKTVVGTVREITKSDFVGVGLPGPENQAHALDFVVDGDFPDEEAAAEEQNLPVRIFRAGAPWTGNAQDWSDQEGEGYSCLRCQFQTVYGLPLSGRDGARGVLVLGRREDKPYCQDDMDFLGQVSNQIGIAVENALAYRRIAELTEKLSQEKLYLEDEIRSESNFEEIIGTSTELHRVLKLVETVAPTDSTVLINGETGTGKELIARAIHNLSARRERTFVKLNCAAIPTGLLESELFGHERGAFTGAIAQRIGRLELANNGTLFLDEIGDIPLELQPKLLRVLQEREFERLGGTRTISTNVRLIAATNRDLAAMVEEGTFRSDLFFRLNVFPISTPALRDRAEDIPLLVRHFAEEFSRRMNKTIDTISSGTMEALCDYPWPGNIRELQNVIERAVIVSPGPALLVPLAEFRSQAKRQPASEKPAAQSTKRHPVRSILTDVDRDQIIQALRDAHGRVGGPAGAASRLGLKRTTFITRMNKLGIVPREVLGGEDPIPQGADPLAMQSSSNI